jgi:hypothetical protein
VAFEGNDGHGGTGTASTTITVNDVGGGGGGEVPAKACLIGSFQSRDGVTCFRIKPVHGSFDLRDVVLSSITFVFHGASVAALNDGTRIEVHCRRGGGDHDGDHGDDDDHGKGHDAAALNLGGDHSRGGDDDDDEDRDCGGVVCGEHGGNDHGPGDRDCDHDDDGDYHGTGNGGGACDTLGIRACFSTQALLDLLAGAKLPCDLVNAEIHATLTSGATVVATFGKDGHPGGDGGDDDDGDDDDKDKKDKDNNDRDKDKHDGDDRDALGHGHHGMNPKVRPNPLNPRTELSFTLAREGRVRVTVYDMRGRLVKTLLDGFRAAGLQSLAWDGSNAHSQKVPSGVYFFRIQAPEGEIHQKVAVVK